MLPLIVMISSFFIATSVMANNEDDVQQLLNLAEQNKQLYMHEAEQLKDQAINHIKKTLQPEKLNQATTATQSCTKANLVTSAQETERKFLIFVSFSMPKSALQALYADAKNHQAVLVLRGLKDSSFKATAEYLKALEISVQIDPESFKKYQINRVPTIVVIGDNKFDSISGNISFQYAKQKLLGVE